MVIYINKNKDAPIRISNFIRQQDELDHLELYWLNDYDHGSITAIQNYINTQISSVEIADEYGHTLDIATGDIIIYSLTESYDSANNIAHCSMIVYEQEDE